MKSLLLCLHCQAVRPREVTICPNCAPRTASWSSWLRGAVGAAGLGLLGATAACNTSGLANPGEANPDLSEPGPMPSSSDGGGPSHAPRYGDAGALDAALADGALVDGASLDAAMLSCFCPILAAYGNFPVCNQPPVAPDTDCPSGGKPMCVTCPK